VCQLTKEEIRNQAKPYIFNQEKDNNRLEQRAKAIVALKLSGHAPELTKSLNEEKDKYITPSNKKY